MLELQKAGSSPSAIAGGRCLRGSIRTSNVVLYASFGSVLTPYALNIDTAELVRSEAVTLPENVQYAWPHGRPARCRIAATRSA